MIIIKVIDDAVITRNDIISTLITTCTSLTCTVRTSF